MKNGNHDLVHQLSEKLDSYWRYDEYKKNTDCSTCQALWDKLKDEDGKHIEGLRGEIILHAKEERFD